MLTHDLGRHHSIVFHLPSTPRTSTEQQVKHTNDKSPSDITSHHPLSPKTSPGDIHVTIVTTIECNAIALPFSRWHTHTTHLTSPKHPSSSVYPSAPLFPAPLTPSFSERSESPRHSAYPTGSHHRILCVAQKNRMQTRRPQYSRLRKPSAAPTPRPRAKQVTRR